MNINGTEYVTVEIAASMLGVTSGRVRQLLVSGELPSLKITKRLNMIPIREVEAFMKIPRISGKRKITIDSN